MTDSAESPDLTALLGSRICHDLINPLGAIGNGVELLMMSPGTPAPEVELIADSVTNANARIRFFRVAFGAAGAGQHIGQSEITQILAQMVQGSRLAIDWVAQGSQPRAEVKMAFLAIQCLEVAMPYGGTVTVSKSADGWRVEGQSQRMKVTADLWALLTGSPAPADLAASAVQFALLPEEAARWNRPISLDQSEAALAILF